MQPSTRAMLWYFWRMSRWNILLLSALSVAVPFIVRAADTGASGSSLGYINLTVQVFLIAVFGGCLFMWGSASSFLPHPSLLTLPLSTRRYLALFYGYVIVVVGACACTATAVHLRLFGEVIQQQEGPRVVLQFWQMPLLCIALASLTQSLFHLSGIKNEFKGLPMAVATEILAFCCVLPVLEPGLNTGHRSGYAACTAMLFALASSYISLSAHHSGRNRDGIAALQELFDLGRGQIRTFSSPGSALFWLGWRRYGQVFPMWAASLSLIGLVLAGGWAMVVSSFGSGDRLSLTSIDFAWVAFLTSTLMTCGAAFLCHILLLMRNHEDLFGTGSAFFLTLPVRTSAIARARLLAMASSVLLVMAVGTSIFLILAYTASGVCGGREVSGWRSKSEAPAGFIM